VKFRATTYTTDLQSHYTTVQEDVYEQLVHQIDGVNGAVYKSSTSDNLSTECNGGTSIRDAGLEGHGRGEAASRKAPPHNHASSPSGESKGGPERRGQHNSLLTEQARSLSGPRARAGDQNKKILSPEAKEREELLKCISDFCVVARLLTPKLDMPCYLEAGKGRYGFNSETMTPLDGTFDDRELCLLLIPPVLRSTCTMLVKGGKDGSKGSEMEVVGTQAAGCTHVSDTACTLFRTGGGGGLSPDVKIETKAIVIRVNAHTAE
jgi:hypothetical protein